MAFLDSLENATQQPATVVLADNGSTDGVPQVKNSKIESPPTVSFEKRSDKQLHDALLVAGGSTRARDTLDKLRPHTQLLTDSTVRNERSLAQEQATGCRDV